MAEWKSANMAAIVPSEIATIASQAQTITSSVATILGVVKTAIDAARPILGFPNIDFASALLLAVENFKNDFLGSGFYACSMWDYPLRQVYRSGYSGELFGESFLDDLIQSFSDNQDPNVPTFSGSTAMLVIVGGTSGELKDILSSVLTIQNAFPTWSDIGAAYDKMYRAVWTDIIESAVVSLKEGSMEYSDKVAQQTSKVLDLVRARADAVSNLSVDDLRSLGESALESIFDVESFIGSVNALVSSSRYPDWESTSLRKVLPPLVDLVDQALDPLTASLQSGAGIIAAIDDFLEVIDFKIAQLQILVDKIDTFLEALSAISSLGGLHALYVTSDSGISGLVANLSSAAGQPFGDSKGFFFGTVLLAGGPGLTPFKNVFSHIGE